MDADQRLGRAVHTLATGLACVLLERGWKAETAPGRCVELVNGSERVEPWTIVQQLAVGALTREQWSALCQRFGIAGVRLLPSGAIAPSRATAD